MGGSLAGEAALFLCEAILAMCINTTANFEHNYWGPSHSLAHKMVAWHVLVAQSLAVTP